MRRRQMQAVVLAVALLSASCGQEPVADLAVGSQSESRNQPAPTSVEKPGPPAIDLIEPNVLQPEPGITPQPLEGVDPVVRLEWPVDRQDIGKGESVPCIGRPAGILAHPTASDPLRRALATRDNAAWWFVVDSSSIDTTTQVFQLGDPAAIGSRGNVGSLATPRQAYETAGVTASLFKSGYESVLIAVSPSGSVVGRAVPVGSDWEFVFSCASGYPTIFAQTMRESLTANGLQPDETARRRVLLSFMGFEAAGAKQNDRQRDVDADVLTRLSVLSTDERAPVELPWNDLSPDRRTFSEAPSEIQNALLIGRLTINVPVDWKGSVGAICAKLDSAWSSCVDLQFQWGEDSDENVGLPLPFEFLEGQSLELRLFSGPVSWDAPFAILGTIQSADLSHFYNADVVVKADQSVERHVASRAAASISVVPRND